MNAEKNFYVKKNWYSNKTILEILYNNQNQYYLFRDSTHLCLDELQLNIKKFGKTLNFLPTYGYNALFCNQINEETIEEILKELRKSNSTTCYLPVQFSKPCNEVFSKEISLIYSDRIPSYNINLSQSLEFIKSNVSKRRRSKLKSPNENIEIKINTDELRNIFPSLYIETMKRFGAAKRFLFNISELTKICNLNNCILIGIKHENKIKLIHLIGFDNHSTNSDFIFSASSKDGSIFSSHLIWETIEHLKSRGFKNYHLGGGIKRNDGLDDIKRQFGGQKIYNGGLKLLINEAKYLEQLSNEGISERDSDFFPGYLLNQV